MSGATMKRKRASTSLTLGRAVLDEEEPKKEQKREEKIEQCERMIEAYELQLSELKSELSESETTVSNNLRKIESLERELDHCKSEIKLYQTENSVFSDENKILIEKNNELSQQINQLTIDYSQTKQNYQQTLEFQKNYFDNRENSKNKRLDSSYIFDNDHSSQNDQKTMESSESVENLSFSSLKEENIDLKERNEQLESKLAKETHEVNRLRNELDAMTVEFKQQKLQIEEMSNTLNKSQMEFDKLNSENFNLKESINEHIQIHSVNSSPIKESESQIPLRLQKSDGMITRALSPVARSITSETTLTSLFFHNNNTDAVSSFSSIIDDAFERESIDLNIDVRHKTESHNNSFLSASVIESLKRRASVTIIDSSDDTKELETSKNESKTTDDSTQKIWNGVQKYLVQFESIVETFKTLFDNDGNKIINNNSNNDSNNNNNNENSSKDTGTDGGIIDNKNNDENDKNDKNNEMIDNSENYDKNDDRSKNSGVAMMLADHATYYSKVYGKFRDTIFQAMKQQKLLQERQQNTQKELSSLRAKYNELEAKYKTLKIESHKKMKQLCMEIYQREYKKCIFIFIAFVCLLLFLIRRYLLRLRKK